MPRRIDLAAATLLLRSRDGLLADGRTERELRTQVQRGELIRVRQGWYVAASDWRDLWPEGRHLLRVLAASSAATSADGPVFARESAAVLWGLPLYRWVPRAVHTVIEGRGHSRTLAGIARHDIALGPDDVVELHGMRVTSLARTVFDTARSLLAEAAVAIADAALRGIAVRGHRQDADLVAAWREEQAALARPGLRGVRQARWVGEFADGRAQLPGESVSRLQLFRLGYTEVDLQVPVTGTDGRQFFMDFAFKRARAFGEFDGEGKYLDTDLRDASSTEAAVLEEKRREDDVRGATGWRFARWGSAHIITADALGSRLAAFRIFPPG